MEEKRKAENIDHIVDEKTAFSSEMMMMISDISSMPNSALFDMSSCGEIAELDHDDHHQKISSCLGFLEMDVFDNCSPNPYSTFDDYLMLQNINNSAADHLMIIPLPESQSQLQPPDLSQPAPLPSPAPEYSEVVNTPATPNSCSISSTSTSTETAAANDDDHRRKIGNVEEDDEDDDDDDDDEDNQEKTYKKQLLKPKKKKQKREREARYAFITKSDVDHLDDGYRWRKYGQKAVKNSPFPRSYYRCTSTVCGVKKRVERSCEDPSTVVTTYEGTHTHPCPIMTRGSFGIMPETAGGRGGGGGSSSSGHFVMPTQMQLQYQQKTQQQQQQQPYFHNNNLRAVPLQVSRFSTISTKNINPLLIQERRFCPSASSSERDHGLLQDMLLPSKMLKEPKEE